MADDAPVSSPEGAKRSFFGFYRYSLRALQLVWTTSPRLTLALGFLSLVAGLLPAGIVRVRGTFRVGDAVGCVDSAGRERARGLVAYTSEDVARIMGLATREVERVLGYSNGAEVIHRDDLVVLES